MRQLCKNGYLYCVLYFNTLLSLSLSLQKGLFSRSETDLHKPKRFATLSFAWKKKKKNTNLSQSFSSISVESEVRGHIRDPDDEIKIEQTFLRQQVPSEGVEIDSLDHDAGSSQEEDPNAVEFMLVNTESMHISHIDSLVSVSDGYCTPPESSGLDSSSQSLTVNDTELHQSYNKYSKITSGQLPDTTIHATAEEGSSLSLLTSTDHMSLSNSPTRMFEGHFVPVIPTPTSSVDSSINSSLITRHHPDRSTSTDSRDHSFTHHQWDVAKKNPQWIVSLDSTTQRDGAEKFEEVNTNLALGYPEQSSSHLSEITDSKNGPADDRDASRDEPEIGFHRDHSHITNDTIQDCETIRKNELNMDPIAGPDYVLSTSDQVPGELVPLSSRYDPEIIYSTIETSSSSFGENGGNSGSDAPPVYLEKDLSPQLTRRNIMVMDPDSATFDFFRSSYTSSFNHSNNFSDLLYEPDQPKQEQEPQEPTISTSLSFNTFNKSLSPESIFSATDHLTSYSSISDLSHQSFSEDHESENCQGNNLEADKYDEERIHEIPAQGLFSRSALFEKTCNLSEEKERHGFSINNEPASEAVIRGNDFYVMKLLNNHLNESVNRKYSQWDRSAVMLNTEENLTRNWEGDVVEARIFQDENMVGSFSIMNKVKENAEEKAFGLEQMFLRNEVDTQVQLGGESEAPPGEVNQKLADLTMIKPDVPVLQVCVSEECSTAPPYSLHGDVSVTDRETETHLYMEAGSGHSQEIGSLIPPQWEDLTGGGVNGSVVRLHVDRDNINTRESEAQSVTYYQVPRFESAEPRGLPETRETFQQIQEQQNGGDQEHQDIVGNPILQSENTANCSRDTCGIFTEQSKTPGGIVVCIRQFGEKEENHQELPRERTLSNHQPAPRYTSLDRLVFFFFSIFISFVGIIILRCSLA